MPWRRHSCLPRPHSWGRSWVRHGVTSATRVETSLDTAGTSACATSADEVVRNAALKQQNPFRIQGGDIGGLQAVAAVVFGHVHGALARPGRRAIDEAAFH